jgi:protocatechuate 3,4-dioxygenase beta subunit
MNKRSIARFALLCLLGMATVYVVADGPPPTPAPPPNVTTVSVIAPASEPGQHLRISGQVFAPDGVTPVAGVMVYAYQTDLEGHYQNDPTTHIARLHGWAKTDEHGRFEFVTIRPGAYPSGKVPAHVHFHLWGAGYPLQWTKDLFFEGDPRLKPEVIDEARAAGTFNNICTITRDGGGTELCHISFRLLKETNYPIGYQDDPRTRSSGK